MPEYRVTWRLTTGGKFSIQTEADSPEAACETIFRICNDMGEGQDAARWANERHRSMSVGDSVTVTDSDGSTPYYCDRIGFRPATERDPVSMEDLLGITEPPSGPLEL